VQQLTWLRLTVVGVAAAILGWVVTMMLTGSGATPLAVPWTVVVVCLVAGVAALWFGWQVRQYLNGDRPSLDGLRAARTVVFAQATAYVGVIVVGMCGGYALGLLEDWSHGPRREVIYSALLAAGAAAVMLIAGIVAERWCRHGDDGEAGSDTSTQTV